MYLLYDLVLLTSAVVLVPWYLLRGWRYGKSRRGIRERLGFYLPGRLDVLAGKQVFWIHAVSVGETRAVIPLVKALKNAYPGCAIVLTNVTETGHEIAGGIREVDLRLFFPFDLSWVVRRALRLIRPSLIIIVETEIWPNFVRSANEAGTPVILVNGRISDRSFPRYRRIRPLVQPILERFTVLCMQTAQDAERIRLLGAPPGRIEITRNLKFDLEPSSLNEATPEYLRAFYTLPEDLPVWVAGSTHGGDEDAIVETYRHLLQEGKRLVLILVPRRPERARGVAEMLSGRGFKVTLRSSLQAGGERLQPGDVLLVDTLGEMLNLYAAADLVFVGGSFVNVGGHNVLEPIHLKKPVVFGPFMQNFKEIANLLLLAGGGMQVEDIEGLQAAVARLLEDSELRRRLGENGYSLLESNAGATRHTLAVIARALER